MWEGGEKDSTKGKVARVRECVCVWEGGEKDSTKGKVARVRECVCGGEKR